jgi:hypothetical protein
VVNAGFNNIAATATYECCEPLSYITDFLAARIEASLTRDDAVARGWATADQVREMTAGLRRFAGEPGGFFAITWCEVIGVR